MDQSLDCSISNSSCSWSHTHGRYSNMVGVVDLELCHLAGSPPRSASEVGNACNYCKLVCSRALLTVQSEHVMTTCFHARHRINCLLDNCEHALQRQRGRFPISLRPDDLPKKQHTQITRTHTRNPVLIYLHNVIWIHVTRVSSL